MIKTPISLQDLRKIYTKAKAETNWRFWGLYVHVCKKETLHEAYALAKKNNGAPGIDGVTFEAIEESGVGEFSSSRYRTNWSATRIVRCGIGGRRYPRTTEPRSASYGSLPSVTAWSREHSSSFWNPSSRLTSRRDRLAIGRSGQLMKRSNESPGHRRGEDQDHRPRSAGLLRQRAA